jgi:YbgC/YbaW family acyl-CoA thioester hydrolase
MNKKPIIYKGLVDVHFSDLDFYGHVNSKHYVDYVSTVRLNYLVNPMNFPNEKVLEKGIGFFMTKSTVLYKRPILGLQKVLAQSHVAEIKNGSLLMIPFSLSNEIGDKVFAEGVLEFAVIDMTTKRPTSGPDWLLDLFFEKD